MLSPKAQERLDALRGVVVACCQDPFVAVLILRAPDMERAVAANSILAQEGWTREGPFVPDGKGYLYTTFHGYPLPLPAEEEVDVEETLS